MPPKHHGPRELLFWPKVNKTDACWLWTASTTVAGYGNFWTGKRLQLAHRYAYELLVGPIPDGLHLDHLCRVPLCVNPDHLEPVTAMVNIQRGVDVGKGQSRKTHCPKGHAYDEANTYLYNGSRHCRACNKDRGREWHRARSARRRAMGLPARPRAA